MSEQTFHLKTDDFSRFNGQVNFGGIVVSFDGQGLAPVTADEQAKVLAGGYAGVYDPANAPVVPVAAPLGATAGPQTEEEQLRAAMNRLRNMKVEDLREQAQSLGLPEAEWKELRKASLVAYLESKLTDAAEEEEEEKEDDSEDEGSEVKGGQPEDTTGEQGEQEGQQ